MTTPSFPMPYTVEFTHGNSVYMTIPASQRNGAQTEHFLAPGQYEVIASYQGNETLTVQYQATGQQTGNIVTTPSPTVAVGAQQSDPVTVIVKEGVSNGRLRVFTTPRSADLTDTTGVGSLLIIPTPRYGDA